MLYRREGPATPEQAFPCNLLDLRELAGLGTSLQNDSYAGVVQITATYR